LKTFTSTRSFTVYLSLAWSASHPPDFAENLSERIVAARNSSGSVR
jgi:hypothetical protein